MEYLYQAIGILALICTVISFQAKEMKQTITIQALGCFLWCVHFLLTKAYAASAMNLITIAKSIGYIKITNPNRKAKFAILISLVYAAFSIVSVIFLHEYWFIALAVLIGTITGNIFMLKDNSQRYRLAQITVISPCWLFNNIWYLSIGGTVCEILDIVSASIALYRFRQNKSLADE